MPTTRERLLDFIEEQFGETVAEAAKEGVDVFVDHGKGWADGSLDSLDRVEFVMAVEDAFSLEIPDNQASGFRTLDDVATYVDAVKSAPKHGAH